MQRELVAASIPRPASRPTGRGSHAPRVRFLVKMGSPNRRASCPFTNPLAQGSTDIATNQPSRSSSTSRPPYHQGVCQLRFPIFILYGFVVFGRMCLRPLVLVRRRPSSVVFVFLSWFVVFCPLFSFYYFVFCSIFTKKSHSNTKNQKKQK